MSNVIFTQNSLSIGLSTYSSDFDFAGSMLHQCADEIDVVIASITDDVEAPITSTLTAIAMRMRFAADIANEEEAMAAE